MILILVINIEFENRNINSNGKALIKTNCVTATHKFI